MKKLFISLMIVVFALSLFTENDFIAEKSHESAFQARSALREEIIVYYEDFEDGMGDWTHYDGTLPASMWHLDDFMTPDGTGLSWWMGDPAIGGYINHLYVVLDTPAITVPTGGHLTFDLTYRCEIPGGEPPPYDGWDGCNVRISTNAGETWEVIEGFPEYTNPSLYSFGFEHGEGPYIPGWCGFGPGWQEADFDLSDYAGQDVLIRFAFASDPAYCTQDDPSMYGMIVDNISLGDFSHDFDDGDEQGMAYTSIVPVGGDIWYLGEPGDAPSPTHAMICQNAQGTYNINMLNYLESPPITFPTEGEIIADFMLKGFFDDNDTFPEIDFFGWEVSPDGGTTWYYMSNPCDDGSPNYVYSDAPEIWSSMIESFSLDGHLDGCDMYEGQDVIFRIYFESDEDDPIGTGIMIDDFTITNIIYPGPGVEEGSLRAEANNSNQSVHLTWIPPQEGGEEGWIQHDNGEYAGSLGLTNGGDWAVATRFTVNEMLPYVDGNLTEIMIYPCEVTADYTVTVWKGPNASTLVTEIPLSNPVIEDWNQVTLSEPVLIESGMEYWIGYQINQPTAGTYPAGYDSGPNVGGLYANLGSWMDLSGDYDYNWLIHGYIDAPDGRKYELTNDRDRPVTGYHIWHCDTFDGTYEIIDTIDPADEYTHTTPIEGAFNYYNVTPLWDGVDGMKHEPAVFDYVISDDQTEAARDDGSAESGFNVGVTKSMAVRFSPDYGVSECTLTHARVYVYEKDTGQMIIRAWDDTGADEMPGTMLFQFVYPSDDLTEGWNTIEIPEANQPTFTSGDFYLGIFEMAGLSAIGLDEGGYGHSYTDVSGSWELEESGNVMIRAIGYGDLTAVGNGLIPERVLTMSNFPNPFNPSTTISLSMPNTGKSKIGIYNIKGQLVKTLVNDVIESGLSQYTWNGLDNQDKPVTSGIYFYKLESDGQVLTRKMLLLK